MESNLERANSRRREGAKPTGLPIGLASRNMRRSPIDPGGRVTEGTLVDDVNDDLKGVLMRCMWFTKESLVTDEATGVAEYRASSLR